MKRITWIIPLIVTVLLIVAGAAGAQGPDPLAPSAALSSGFTYQGQLKQNGVPVSAICDLQFGLWSAPSGGSQFPSITQTITTTVTGGLFTALLDFGPDLFDGNARYLAIAARCPAGSGNFTPLDPRQPLTAAPYALYALAPWIRNGSFIYYPNSNVGINTSTPDTRLHVVRAWAGSAGNAGDHVALIENNSAIVGNGPDVLALKITNLSAPDSTMNYITFFDQSGAIAAIEGNGSGGVTYKTSGSDLAEYLPARSHEERLERGEVVALRDGRLTRDTRDATQLFAVSGPAGFVGNMPMGESAEQSALVAMVGQVPVRVRGMMRAGDFIIPSGENDGVGIAVALGELTTEQATQVVGRALENSDGGTVKTLVGLSRDAVWAELLQEKELQLASLEARLSTLEQTLPANNVGSHSANTGERTLMVIGVLLVIIVAQKSWRRGD